jgi:DNA-binding transcriptional regulator YhcF (GntR family)
MSYKLLQAAARVKGLTPYERCVLITLADRSNQATNKCWPSVARMASDTGVSEREVHRALKRLRALGMITVSGKTKHGTNVYLLQLKDESEKAVPDLDEVPHASPASASPAVDECHAGGLSMSAWQINKGMGPGTEQGKQHIHTSTINPVLAHALVKKQPQQTVASQGPSSVGKLGVLQGPTEPTDSKLVKKWKAAHAQAGLKCNVSAVEGKKLSLLVKGEYAITYQEAIETLIPKAVSEWTVMCIYLSKKYGISLWGKKPLPKWPHAGFLLRHRKEALEFCEQTPMQRATSMFLYVKPYLEKMEYAV